MTFAVASGHALTSQSAAEVLRTGGSAVDAAIAAAFTAFVVEPVLAGPLGGGFLMLAPSEGKPALLDAFVQTPSRKATDVDISTITVDFGTALQDFHIGAGTIASPVLIPALFEAHARLGKLPMPTLVEQACQIAREGHALTEFQAHVLKLVAPIFSHTSGARALYGTDDGVLQEGQTLANPALADVLEVMAHEGPRFFTEGEVAAALLDQPGSHLSAQDLTRAAPIWRAPLQIARGGHDIVLNPAPSLGGVQVALALGALPHTPSPAEIALALAEIAKLRRDTKLDDTPQTAHRLLAPDLTEMLQRTLTAHRAATRGTTHISIVDTEGTGIALTLSNGEGCGHVLPGTGIMPNNMLGEDDLVPDGPDAWVPDRRLASMMCPMAMVDAAGTLTLLGSGGSNRIRSALTQTALHLADGGLSLDAAIAAPRLHVERDGRLDFEDIGSEERREALLHHWPDGRAWPQADMFFGGVHAVRRNDKGAFDAAGDARRGGHTLVG